MTISTIDTALLVVLLDVEVLPKPSRRSAIVTEIAVIQAATKVQTTQSPLFAFSRRTAIMIPQGLAAHASPSRMTLVRSLLTRSARGSTSGERTPLVQACVRWGAYAWRDA
jgi:hypothetical protein